MDKIFYPKSLVVVGVSEKADNLARHIARNLLQFGYRGELYLLGRDPGFTLERPILTSAKELPTDLDLAVILTPACTVPDLLDELGERGIRHAVIESAGFSEFSSEGAHLEEKIRLVATKWGIRVVGPNCIGILSTDSGICTIFVPTEPGEVRPGRCSLMSQSGGVVLTCVDMWSACGLGVAKTVSAGNKLDLKEGDYLRYFIQDTATDIITLYLESINAGRELVDLASCSPKPIIVYKANTSLASSQIAQSHTAALANDERVVDAALRQFGIARARTFRQLMTFSKGFSLPPVRGNRLAVFSRSGGHAIIAVDCASHFQFELPSFCDELIDKAKPYFRVDVIDRMNPLDLGTVFNFDAYPLLIEESIKIMQPDAVILIFNYRRETIPTARVVAEKIKTLSQQYQLPIALCYFSEMEEIEYLEKNLGYPVFTEVYEAVEALAASRDRCSRVNRRSQQPAARDVTGQTTESIAAARSILTHSSGGNVSIDQALQVCDAFGLPITPWEKITSPEQAAQTAARLGYPLAVKAISRQALHKTEVGGVTLNIESDHALLDTIKTMQLRFSQQGLLPPEGFILQKMLTGGREIILGGKRDPSFGPLVLLGLGGIYAEVFGDVALRLAPIQAFDVEEMLNELRGGRLLTGVRGQPSIDRPMLVETMLGLSRLLVEMDEILEIDLNPVLAFENGVQIVDARIILKD